MSIVVGSRSRGEGRSRGGGGRGRLAPLLACFLLAAGACQDGGLTLDEVRARGFLRAGYTDEPPYAFVDSSGEVTGESPGALRAAADSADVPEIRWVRLDFRELIPALQQGRVDVLAAGLYRTPEREASVRFTRPTSCSGPALVVRDESVIRGLADLAEEGRRVAVLAGSVEEAAARASGLADDKLLPLTDLRTGLVAVRQGAADALAVTEPTARYAARGGLDGLEVVRYAPPPAVEHLLSACSALAFRREDGELADAIDAALSRVVGSEERRAALRALGFTLPAPAATAHGGDS